MNKVRSMEDIVNEITGARNDYHSFFGKQAAIEEKDVLGGDRTDTHTGGVPHSTFADAGSKEMGTESLVSGNPQKEGYDPKVTDAYNMDAEREREAMAMSKKPKRDPNEQTDAIKKAFDIGNELLLEWSKEAQDDTKTSSEEQKKQDKESDDKEEQEERKDREMGSEDSSTESRKADEAESGDEFSASVSSDDDMSKEEYYDKMANLGHTMVLNNRELDIHKQAGYEYFHDAISTQNGPEELHKIASIVDPVYQQIYKQAQANALYAGDDMHKSASLGAQAVDNVLQKRSSANQDPSLTKSASLGADAADNVLQKVATQIATDSYGKGVSLADYAIQKQAADILPVRHVIQLLMSEGKISQEEKEHLVHTLASSERLTPEVAVAASKSLKNSELVAQALIKGIEGPQGVNTVPKPANPVSVPMLPPHEAGVDGVIAGDSKDQEDELIIQAGLRVANREAQKLNKLQ